VARAVRRGVRARMEEAIAGWLVFWELVVTRWSKRRQVKGRGVRKETAAK
jgi:hypothetical protein